MVRNATSALLLAILLPGAGLLVPAAGFAQESEEGSETPAEAPSAETPTEAPSETPDEAPAEPAADDATATEEPDGAETPAAEGDPEPVVSDPEPVVSEETPETTEPTDDAPLATPAPEGAETGRALGRQPETEASEASEASGDEPTAEASASAGAAGEGEGEDGEAGTADRLAAANPTVEGINWSMPTTLGFSMTARTLDPGAQFTYDPTFSMSLALAPRYILPVKGLTVGALQRFSLELTDSNLTAGDRQIWPSDLRLDLTYTLPWKPGGVMFIGAARLLLPTSQISIGANRYAGPGGTVIAMRSFPVLGGLIVGGQFLYNYWFSGSNVTRPRGGEILCSDGLGNSTDSCLNVTANPNHTLGAGIFITLIPFDRAQINFSLYGQWLKDAPLADACTHSSVVTPDGMSHCIEDGSRTKWNTINTLSLGFGYDVMSYMTLSFTYNALSFFPDSDGSFENFLWNENSSFSLSLQFRPAGLAGELRKEPEAEDDE